MLTKPKTDFYRRFMAEANERRMRARKLRDAGKTYEEIGAALGISKQRAHNLVRRARREWRMPNRILRDSALDSDRIAAVDEASEVLFYRLLMLADDFGRFDGRVSVIRARAYALRQSVSEAQVIHRLKALCKVGLIQTYEVAGKPYLVIPRFGQRQRAEKSKFPSPDSGVLTNDCQVTVKGLTAAPVVVDVVVDKAVGDVPASRGKFADDDATASPMGGNKGNGSAVAYIPLNDGSEYPVTQAMVDEFSRLYPALDIPQTLNEIRGWNIASPEKRKTRKGVLKHINAWFSKEQNRGPQK